jgi:hypothetical protein
MVVEGCDTLPLSLKELLNKFSSGPSWRPYGLCVGYKKTDIGLKITATATSRTWPVGRHEPKPFRSRHRIEHRFDTSGQGVHRAPIYRHTLSLSIFFYGCSRLLFIDGYGAAGNIMVGVYWAPDYKGLWD